MSNSDSCKQSHFAFGMHLLVQQCMVGYMVGFGNMMTLTSVAKQCETVLYLYKPKHKPYGPKFIVQAKI